MSLFDRIVPPVRRATGLVEAGARDLEKPAQDVLNMSRELYRLVGRGSNRIGG